MWNPKQLSTWVSLPGSLPPSPPPSEHCLAEPAESDLSAPTFHFLHIFRQNQHRSFLYRAVDFNNCPICVCWLVGQAFINCWKLASSWQEPNEFRSKIEILRQCKDNTWSHLQSSWTQLYRRCGALKPTYIFSGNFSCIVCLFVYCATGKLMCIVWGALGWRCCCDWEKLLQSDITLYRAPVGD